jgi:type IV pilus assembly protein PilX
MLSQNNLPGRQSGVVLVISLIMLLLLTLIGITGMQTTSLEEKMAGNARDRNIAFQAAESTLLEAEKFIHNNPTTAIIYDGTNGLLDTTDIEPDYFTNNTWSAANSAATPINFGDKFSLSTDPRYIIKKIASLPANGSVGPRIIFKITARAVGSTPGTQVILQEVYEKS